MKITQATLLLVTSIAVLICWGCNAKSDDLKAPNSQLIMQYNTRLDSIRSVLDQREPPFSDVIVESNQFLTGLKSSIQSGVIDGTMLKHNVDSLSAALTDLTVKVKDFTVTQDWLTGTTIKTEEHIRVTPFSSSEKQIEYIEVTGNNIEKRAKTLHDANSHWSKQDCVDIVNRKIWIGMSDDQLKKSMGRPHEVNRTVGAWGNHEQWVYGDWGPYVYVENGIVTSWQD